MTLEEKLKEKSIPLMQKYMWIDQPTEMQKEQVILLKDALSICHQEIDEARIEELKRLLSIPKVDITDRLRKLKGEYKMTTDRIKEIQNTTGYPDSVPVQQALLQVWNEVAQESNQVQEQNKSLEQQLLDEYYGNYEITKPDESEIQNLKSLIGFVLNKIYQVQSAKDNHLTDKEFKTLSVRITPSFYDIDLDGATNCKGDILRKLRIIINDIIDSRKHYKDRIPIIASLKESE